MHNSDAWRRKKVEWHSSTVMPRFRRGIQYAVTSHASTSCLWNTGSPGQVYGPGTWVTPFGDMGNTSTA
jgi:hypothetical protein